MIGEIAGYYRIVEKIGEGGMCTVFKAEDLMQHRAVALKVIRPEFAREQQIVDRFCGEAVTLAKLNHPNVASVYGFFRHDENFFIAMEYVPGETLDQIIHRDGAISWKRAVQLFSKVLDGIDHAHQLGIIHRDIKPGNVMLTGDDAVKVMDFGIARMPGVSRVTRDGSVVGTPAYMSPEQIRGMDLDTRSDIYSLGVLLYELLTGRLPFVSTSDYELMRAHVEESPLPIGDAVPDLPPLVNTAIMRALKKSPGERFQTAREFRAVLDHGLATPSVTSNQSTPNDFALATGGGEIWFNHTADVKISRGETAASHSDTLPETKEIEMEVPPTSDQLAGHAEPSATQTRDVAIEHRVLSHKSKSTWRVRLTAGAAAIILVGAAYGLLNVISRPVELPPSPPLPLNLPANSQPLTQKGHSLHVDPLNSAESSSSRTRKKTSPAGEIIHKAGSGLKRVGRVLTGRN